jgi:hypothetical protein
MDWFSSRAACQSSDDWEATQHTESVVTMLFPLNDSPYQRIYEIMKKKPICVALEGETIEALDERRDQHALARKRCSKVWTRCVDPIVVCRRRPS